MFVLPKFPLGDHRGPRVTEYGFCFWIFSEGKSMYILHDARELWDKIIKLSEKINVLR